MVLPSRLSSTPLTGGTAYIFILLDALRHGFYAGFAGSAAGSVMPHVGLPGYEDTSGPAVAARTAAAAVVGGTASVLGGGKFENGAVTAAFQHLYNDEHSALANMFRGMTGYNSPEAAVAMQQAKQSAAAELAKELKADEAAKAAILQKKAQSVLQTEVYLDVSVGFSLVFAGAGGVFIDDLGISPYWAYGLSTPGPSASMMMGGNFTGPISPGKSWQIQGGALGGAAAGKGFVEGGLTTPGVSLMRVNTLDRLWWRDFKYFSPSWTQRFQFAGSH